jgi:hypothetical protein
LRAGGVEEVAEAEDFGSGESAWDGVENKSSGEVGVFVFGQGEQVGGGDGVQRADDGGVLCW